jgi:NAD(P)-dependent dehydrogenase (short-subunit alcohol dehydrogenase family)
VVTGGNSGIGLETCKALAYAGCKVIMGSRNVENGKNVIQTEILLPGHGGYVVPEGENLVSVVALDLENLASVKEFANEVLKEERIDFLIFNAGIMALPQLEYTAAGFEKQIGVNHFGHFYLFKLLREKMVQQPFNCRLIALSSTAHGMAKLDTTDLHFKKHPYAAWGSYGDIFVRGCVFCINILMSYRQFEAC